MALSSTPVPEKFSEIWAKSANAIGADGETLTQHTARVLGNLARLRTRSPHLAELCRMPRFWLRAALAAAVHDLGKCAAGFQATLRGGPPFRHRHEVLSALFLRWLLPDDPENDLPWSAAAVLTHHKNWAEICDLYPVDLLGDSLQPIVTADFLHIAQALFIEKIWPTVQAFGLPVSDLAVRQALPSHPTDELAAVLTATDRLIRIIHAQPYNSPQPLAGRFLRGAMIISDHAGSAHVSLKMAAEFASAESALVAVGRTADSLYDHQRLLSRTSGNAILTAPTGSGKTEGAILWAAATGRAHEGKPVLFYVLPYQASLNAMHARLERYFSGNVSLQHSKAIQALYRQLLERDYAPRHAAVVARKEAALARLHATAFRALTPYQLLRAAFQLKGHEAVWTDVTGGLVILDEIHAYDPQRLGMILATLRHMARDLGIHALIMSATLPKCLAGVLQSILPGCSRVEANAKTYEEFRRHRIHTHNAGLLDDTTVDRIVADASAGSAVLVVATTVGRAQALFRLLRKRLGPVVELLHGRFHAEHRFEKEQRLLLRRGPNSEVPALGMVLVATQVVEVSLDVDFDVLYSDPAPLEALLQRFGRINRRRKSHLRDVHVMCAVPEGSPVYDKRLIEAAVSELQTIDGQPLDEALVQTLLDRVYAGERGDLWAIMVARNIDDFEVRVLASLKPFNTDESIETLFDQLFDGIEVLPNSEEQKYLERREQNPLLAPSLLVPITKGQFAAMLRSGRLEKRNDVWVANVPYSETDGLHVNAPASEDGV